MIIITKYNISIRVLNLNSHF